MHNVEEKRVVGLSLEAGLSKSEADLARKTALETNDALKDAPLSTGGHQQIQSALEGYQRLLDRTPYCAPEIVLVSPLRRTLQTATRLFGSAVRIVAVELLREKRTGMACDERSSVADLAAEFPQVEFQEIEAWISTGEVVPEGEDNAAVRKRAARFLDDDLPRREASTLAVVSHKGYLRELRAMLKERADNKHSNLQLDFDLNLEVTGTVFGNAEVRIAEFSWQANELCAIVSRSLEHAIKRAMRQSSMMLREESEPGMRPLQLSKSNMGWSDMEWGKGELDS